MRDCRITDLSLGGCFIDAYASNPIGTRLVTELRLFGQTYRLDSEVVFVDRVQGFAVRFVDTDLATLRDLANALAVAAHPPVVGRTGPAAPPRSSP
jgi:hypothetical protein